MSLLTPAQAETLIEQHLACLPIESLPLRRITPMPLRPVGVARATIVAAINN